MPWPPFGFQSGMGVEDVSREDARKLGLKVDEVEPDTEKGLNSELSASVKTMAPNIKKKFVDELRANQELLKERRVKIKEENKRIRLERMRERQQGGQS